LEIRKESNITGLFRMKKIQELDEDFDFGFSVVSEDELKTMEKQLQSELQQTTEVISQTQNKLEGMRNMIMPLLKNLMTNPDKEYIYWPNRTEKIKAFIDKLNRYVDD
jgi:septal ring factor EnvC (AmiA/AmiB activator)